MIRFFQFLENQKTYSQTRILKNKMNDFCFFQTGKNGRNTTRFNGRYLKHQDSTTNDTINGISKILCTGSKKGRSDKNILKCVQGGGRGYFMHRERTGIPFSNRGRIADCRIVRPRSVPIGVNAAPDEQLQVEITLTPNLFKDKKVSRVFPNVRYKTTHHKSDALFSVGFISAPVHHTGVVWVRTASIPWFPMEWKLGKKCMFLVIIAMTTVFFATSTKTIPLMLEN